MSREQHRGQEPLRRRPHRRQIVGVDQQGIGADLIRDEGDGISLRDEYSTADSNNRCIEADSRADHNMSVPYLGKTCEERAKQIDGDFPNRKD